MRTFSLAGIGLFIGLVILTGCKPPAGSPAKGGDQSANKRGEESHEHGTGPHGGTIFDFGKWHAEFTVNHVTQEATVYILGRDEKTTTPIQTEKLLLSIKAPRFQIDLQAAPQPGDPAGKSSRFVGKHENFGKEQNFQGTLSGELDGKPYAGDFKEEPEKKDMK
jgi:hypothetical protein